MKILLPLLLLLTLAGCENTEYAQSRINSLRERQASLQHIADTTSDPEVRAEALRAIGSLREEESTVRAEDYGRQASFWGEVLLAASGVGGVAGVIARKFGKSRASGDVSDLRAKLEAFERGLQQPAPWVHPGPGELHVTNYPLKSSTGTSEPPTTETT